MALDIEVNLPTGVEEASCRVADFQEATAGAEADRVGSREQGVSQCPSAFFGIDPGDDRQIVRSQPLDCGGVEFHIGIDPEQLLKTLRQRVGRHLTAGKIDLRIPRHPPDGKPHLLKLPQRRLANELDARTDGNQNDAFPAVVHHWLQ